MAELRAGARPAAGSDDAVAAELQGIEQGRLPVGPGDGVLVIRHLSHPKKSLRRLAAGALGAAIRRGAIPAEVCDALLRSGDEHHRWGAAFALARAGRSNPAAVDVALATLASSDGDVRWAAASIVRDAAGGSAELRERLRQLAVYGSPTQRKMALLCLAGSGGEREAKTYVDALGDPEPLVRIAAMTALARANIRDDDSMQAVRAVASEDPQAPVRRAAEAVLRRLTTPEE